MKPRTTSNKPVAALQSKKKLVLSDLFAHCKKAGEFTFDNELVKAISTKHGFKNHFDATKADNLSTLPMDVRKQGYCIVHLGEGKHQFVKAVKHCFHNFEAIQNKEIPWRYRKSALNETDTSESNILSVGFNQRIVHDFLYEDIVASPKVYGSRRTKIDASYKVGTEQILASKLQMEVDMITEYQGVVTVFEGKNNFPKNFAVYQLFHPFIYFEQLRKSKKIKIKAINCCYLLRKFEFGNSIIRLYLYTFSNTGDMGSICLKKHDQYRLIER